MKQPHIITIAGRKGGVGKTTLALMLAAHYTNEGHRTLLVDLDPQGSATIAVGVRSTGADLAACLEEAQAPSLHPVAVGLDILPGGPELEDIEDMLPIREALARVEADVIVIDCPPGHAALDRLAMDAADVILIGCEAHRLAIAGAARVLEDARERTASMAIVVGRMDPRRSMDQNAPEVLAAAMRVDVLIIPQDARVAAAMNTHALPVPTGKTKDALTEVLDFINLPA